MSIFKESNEHFKHADGSNDPVFGTLDHILWVIRPIFRPILWFMEFHHFWIRRGRGVRVMGDQLRVPLKPLELLQHYRCNNSYKTTITNLKGLPLNLNKDSL